MHMETQKHCLGAKQPGSSAWLAIRADCSLSSLWEGSHGDSESQCWKASYLCLECPNLFLLSFKTQNTSPSSLDALPTPTPSPRGAHLGTVPYCTHDPSHVFDTRLRRVCSSVYLRTSCATTYLCGIQWALHCVR